MSSLLRPASTAAVAGLLLAACGGDDGPTGPGPGPPGDVPAVVEMETGELTVRDPGGDGLAFRLPGADGPSEYVVIAQGTATTPGFTPLGLAVSGGEGSSASASVSASPGRGLAFAPDLASSARRRLGSDRLSRRIRENALRVLTRRNVRPATPAAGPGERGVRRSSLLPTDSVPREGDTLRVRLTVQEDLSVSCDLDSARVVTSVVEAVGDEVAILADTLIADDASAQMNWSGLADEYDQSVLGVPEAYFGEATDIDDNQRVLVLFTPEVNMLTERGSDVFIGGFFVPVDLADSGDPAKDGSPININESRTCPAGNEAEIVYLRAPDPSGEFSDTVSVETARRGGLGASPGEFEHLINTGNRVIDQGGTFDQVETTWLDEGLSHVAEEVVGLARADLPVRANLDLARAADTDPEVRAFNTFHLANFLRLRRYLINPDSTPALSAEDPQGLESLEMRGFGYLFLRWLGDQEGPAGSGVVDGSNEQQLFRALARGSGQLATGTANVEAATSEEWDSLIRDFAAAVAADDTIPTGPRLQVLTWNLPAVFRQLHENFERQGITDNPFPEPYPVEMSDLGSPADLAVDLTVQAAGARYYRVSAPAGDTLTVRLTRPDGSPLGAGASARVLLLRAN